MGGSRPQAPITGAEGARAGPAHKLFSAAKYYIGIYRICQEKNFIFFELLALHIMP